MSRPEHPSRARRGALAATLIALPALAAPAAASADYTSANQWGGGTLAADRFPGASIYPAKGTLVSMTTSPTKARLSLYGTAPRCGSLVTLTGRVTPLAGGDAERLTIAVDATRRVRRKGERLDYAVTLRPAGPGVLSGTASIRGSYRFGRRTIRCNLTTAVVLRSRSALNAPFGPSSTDPALLRTGVVTSTIKPRVKAAIAIAKRRDGQYHAIFTERIPCRSGSIRSSVEGANATPRFRIRADGTFRGREVIRDRGRTQGAKIRGSRFSYRRVGVIEGRIDPDGVARGTVTSTSRYKETGYLVRVCRLPRTSFAAAP